MLALGPGGFAPSANGRPTFSSRALTLGGGLVNDPGALNIEFDCPVNPYDIPHGNFSIKIWGIGLRQISQGANLNSNPATGALGASVVLSGGMAPWITTTPVLATAQTKYAGVLVAGNVFQAYGNWQGVEQTLEMIVMPGQGFWPTGGISLFWQPGQLLSTTLYNSLKAAFPQCAVNVNIQAITQSQSSVAQAACYRSLPEFAGMLTEMTKKLGAQQGLANYDGVRLVYDSFGKTLVAFDGTAPVKTIALQFQDLIGQPTWIGPNQLTFKTILRADIQVGYFVTFPAGIAGYVLTSQSAAAPGVPASSSSTFQGTFLVQEVHHRGNFRQADGDSWATDFVATFSPQVPT